MTEAPSPLMQKKRRDDGCHQLLPSALQLSSTESTEDDSIRKVTPTNDMGPSAETTQNEDATQDLKDLLWHEAKYRKEDARGTSKRTDYLTWDDYFMATAILSSHRSKDPSQASGACLVDTANRIIGTGYNGFPSHCSDDMLPWDPASASSRWLHSKDPFVVHAEVNAILNKCAADCSGARLFTQWFPSNDSTKVIIQSGVREVIYMDHAGNADDDTYRASRIMLAMANVQCRQYKPSSQAVSLDFEPALTKDVCECSSRTENGQKVRSETMDTERDDALRDLLMREAFYDPRANKCKKRLNYLSWDDYFLSMAFLTAKRSKDPNTQVGACIVDTNKRIVGLGYNGFPMGCSDDVLPWSRQGDSMLHTKYAYVCHAEVNAIMNKGSANVQGATLYVALFPCNECAKVIIQAGIREVVFMSDIYHDTDACRASRILFEMAGVKLRKHIPIVDKVSIDLTSPNQETNDAA